MKTIINLKIKLVKLFTIVFLLPSLGGIGGGLYAQDPQLFEHTWYFVNGELNGVAFTPPHSSLVGELFFSLDALYISHSYCEEGAGAEIIDFDNTGFTLDYLEAILIGVCGEPYDTEFMNKHYNIYGQPNDFTQPPNNPFTYTLQAIGNYHELTIENGEGDWAVYNSVLLSTPNFSQNSFALYPNPVIETLHINNASTHSVSATIYDINGKLLQSQSLDTSTSTINVKAFNPGLYFVVFESESGERVSKKFIKN